MQSQIQLQIQYHFFTVPGLNSIISTTDDDNFDPKCGPMAANIPFHIYLLKFFEVSCWTKIAFYLLGIFDEIMWRKRWSDEKNKTDRTQIEIERKTQN